MGCGSLRQSVKRNALTQDWRGTVPLVLPNFHELDKTLDILERDDADAVLVVPEWPFRA